jgi:hypothetical protein
LCCCQGFEWWKGFVNRDTKDKKDKKERSKKRNTMNEKQVQEERRNG